VHSFDGHIVASDGSRYYFRAYQQSGKRVVTYFKAGDLKVQFSRVEIALEVTVNGGYIVRANNTSTGPALVFQPPQTLDHNAAFHYTAPETGWQSWLPWPFRNYRVLDTPLPVDFQHGQLVDAAGKPVVDMGKVAVWRGHGEEWGYAGMTTGEAAWMAAEEIS